MTSPEAPVEIVPYDPSWPRRFEEEAEVLRRALATWLLGPIEHIGSTAVPGLAAKPVIDIMAGVQTLEESRPAIAAATGLGYCYAPYQVEHEHWFCKPSFGFPHPSPASRSPWGRHNGEGRLPFAITCAPIRTLPASTKRLKRRLAVVHRLDREAYTHREATVYQSHHGAGAEPGHALKPDRTMRA